jgi:hypothetical protein
MLRETTVSLGELAEQIREERIGEIKAERQAFVDDIADEVDGGDVPREYEREYQQYNQRIKAAEGTAQSLEHYADAAGEDDAFTLRELNADQFAAVLDKVDAAGTAQQRAEGDLPKGVGMIESLKRGVADCPSGIEPDPGAWPAALVRVLHDELDSLTSADASEVELGNDTLADALAAR